MLHTNTKFQPIFKSSYQSVSHLDHLFVSKKLDTASFGPGFRNRTPGAPLNQIHQMIHQKTALLYIPSHKSLGEFGFYSWIRRRQGLKDARMAIKHGKTSKIIRVASPQKGLVMSWGVKTSQTNFRSLRMNLESKVFKERI